MQDICENNHGGNEFSTAAYHSTPESVRATQRLKAWNFIESKGMYGATCDEYTAATVADTSAHSTSSARFSELKKAQMIIQNGSRPTRAGKHAAVWVAKTVYDASQKQNPQQTATATTSVSPKPRAPGLPTHGTI